VWWWEKDLWKYLIGFWLLSLPRFARLGRCFDAWLLVAAAWRIYLERNYFSFEIACQHFTIILVVRGIVRQPRRVGVERECTPVMLSYNPWYSSDELYAI
jgi:hypothetical protein